MDPMTALGLASNIIQLISFTSDIVSKSREIYKSQDGKLVEHLELEAITNNLQGLSSDLVFPMQRGGLSKHDENLRELCEGCRDISRQLLGVIQDLQAYGGNRKWNSFRQALKTIWKEEEIETLSRRLDRYRAQIDTTLLVSLTIILRKQVSKEGLPIENLDPKEGTLAGPKDTERWAVELVEAVRQHNWQSQNQQDVANFSSQVSMMTEIQRQELQKARILESLRFTNMGDRHERIEDAHRMTFEWVFLSEDAKNSTTLTPQELESLSRFPDWLCGNEGMYWITGKPGSGKSTLTKYLYNDERTVKYLHEWAGQYPLVTAGFFFWTSGTAMQMSKMGLLRGLLHQSIKGQTSLVPTLFPDRWRSYELFGGDVHPWSWDELSQALETLISDTSKRFCFFIDGLDEFDGDCAELAKFTLEKSVRPNVKLCVASRPWLVFEDAFQRQPSLRLEVLTAKDIQLFASDKLRGSSMFTYLENLQPDDARELIIEVTGKACGVFLWVRLVIISLLEGLQDGDTIADLHRRLLLLPSDLEELFLKILKSLNQTYFEQASRLFQYVRAGNGPLSLWCLSFAEEGFDKALSAPIKALTTEEEQFRKERMRRRLASCCKGLLEVPAHSSNEVQYLHRTAKDFLESPKIWDYIRSGAPKPFDPDLMLCGAFLYEAKSMAYDQFTLQEAVSYCVYHSLKFENEARDAHLSGLKELDRTVTTLIQGSKGLYGKTPLYQDDTEYLRQWSAVHGKTRPAPIKSFFDYAFMYPLHTYVENELSAGYFKNLINGRPLLYVAAELDDSFITDRRMTKILLRHGADPNRRTTGLTPWQKTLSSLDELNNSMVVDPLTWRNWAEAIQLFLEQDADPNVVTKNMPLETLIEKIFAPWDRRRTNILLDLCIASKKRQGSPKNRTRRYSGLKLKSLPSNDSKKEPRGIGRLFKRLGRKTTVTT